MTEEDELMVAYQKGDQQALENIYITFKRPLYSFIYRYSQDEQLSVDVVQDTFVQLQRYKNNFEPEKGHLKSYLFQIAYRLMVTALNRRKRWRKYLPFLATDPPVIDQEGGMDIRRAIGNLPDIQRVVIILFYYHDLPQKDIATVLDIPLGTVKSRLYNAIKNLQKELGD